MIVEQNDTWLTTKEACELLKISKMTLMKYIHSGKLKAYKLGGDTKSKHHWRISFKDLTRMIHGGD